MDDIELFKYYSYPIKILEKLHKKVRGEFNKFTDFFLQAFKIGVDS